MNKLKVVLTTLLIIFFCPFIVDAATSLKASTQTPIVGSIIYVEVDIDYGTEMLIKDAHYIIEYDTDDLQLEEVIWTQSKGTYKLDSGKIYIDKTDNTQPWEYGGQVLLKLKVLSEGQNKVLISENGVAHYSDGAVVSQTFSGITINAVAPASDKIIGSLSVEGYDIAPTFSKNQYEYRLNVLSNVSQVNVIAKKGASSQTITGDGIRNLEYGDNRVRVVVTAENGATTTYEIMINRKDDRNGDTSLLNLSVSNTNIKYEEDKYTYYATVSRSVDSVLISARATDQAATLAGIGTKALEIGRNVFDITVESSGNKVTKYTIVITRSEEELKPNIESTNLSSLIVNNKIIELEDDKTIYLMGVTEDTKILNVDYETESETATVTIDGGNKLVDGINILKLTVKEANDETKEYRIIVYKDPSNYKVVSSLADYTTDTIDVIYKATEQETHIIKTDAIKNIKDNKSIVHYNVVNKINGLIYSLTIPNELMDTLYDFDTEFKQTSQTPLTYQTTLPKGVEIKLYVGDTYMDKLNVKLYTYNDIGRYTLITEGLTVIDGYITFTTNGETNYVITTASLIKNKLNALQWFKANILKIIIIIAVICLISYFGYKQYLKKHQPISNEPY